MQKHYQEVIAAIKNARFMTLLPYFKTNYICLLLDKVIYPKLDKNDYLTTEH